MKIAIICVIVLSVLIALCGGISLAVGIWGEIASLELPAALIAIGCMCLFVGSVFALISVNILKEWDEVE